MCDVSFVWARFTNITQSAFLKYIRGRILFSITLAASKCTSVHDIGILVLNKWMKCVTKLNLCLRRRYAICDPSILLGDWTPCSHKSHIIILVTVHDIVIIWAWCGARILKFSQQWKIATRATAARARDSKHQSNHRHTKPATGRQINVTL